jgi:hypothetical protein
VRELRPVAAPARDELLSALRTRIASVVPGFALIAEDVLGASAPIDLVGSDPAGRAVLVFIGGDGDDLELIGRGLAQHAWFSAHVGDWLKLAPDLSLRPEAGALVVLLCPAFRAESVAAARAVSAPPIALATLRFLQDGASIEPLIEPVGSGVPAPAHAARAPGVPAAAFRTGLTEEDLELSSEEHADFE